MGCGDPRREPAPERPESARRGPRSARTGPVPSPRFCRPDAECVVPLRPPALRGWSEEPAGSGPESGSRRQKLAPHGPLALGPNAGRSGAETAAPHAGLGLPPAGSGGLRVRPWTPCCGHREVGAPTAKDRCTECLGPGCVTVQSAAKYLSIYGNGKGEGDNNSKSNDRTQFRGR